MQHSAKLPDPHWIWDVPFHPITFNDALAQVDALVQFRSPTYFVTANLNYVMLAHVDPQLRDVHARAAFVVADGITLVWASRWKGAPLPERVTGADLVFGLCELATKRGYSIFLLGGGPGVAEAAARNLTKLYPGLRIAGIASPPLIERLAAQEEAGLVDQIRSTGADLLFVSLGQPKGEHWILRHLAKLGVPVSVQVGGAIDFAAGRLARAPRWIQRFGLETPFRIAQEPRRLTPRYTRNALFLIRMIIRDVHRWLRGCTERISPVATRSSAKR